MKKSVINFFKAEIRMPHLIFWDWIFPLLLVGIISLFIKENDTARFLFPGLISMLILQSIIFSVPYRLAQFKELGIFKLISQKGSILKFLISFFASRVLILIIQIIFMLIIGKWALKLELNVSWIVLFSTIFLSIVLFMIIASICGLIVKTQNSALGLAQAVYFLFIGASGIFYPLEKSPEILKILSKFLPLTYINDLWRVSLFNSGTDLKSNLLILSVMTAILLIVLFSILLVSKRRGSNENSTQIKKYGFSE